MRPHKRLKRYLVYLVLRALVAALGLVPWPLARRLATGLGALAHHLAGRERRRAIEQLRSALGVSADEARRITRRMFEHLGLVVLEVACLPRIDLEREVRFPDEARAVLDAAVAEGKGVIMVSAHLGNWELLAQRIAHAGYDSATIARPSPNPYLGAWLAARRAARVEVIDRGDASAARKMLSVLRRGALLGMLIDQDTRVQSVMVPFFGRPAATPVAPAQLALRRAIPVIAAFIEREGTAHRIRLERVHLSGGPEQATAVMSAAIEAAIRRAPEQWVWFHERWRRDHSKQ